MIKGRTMKKKQHEFTVLFIYVDFSARNTSMTCGKNEYSCYSSRRCLHLSKLCAGYVNCEGQLNTSTICAQYMSELYEDNYIIETIDNSTHHV